MQRLAAPLIALALILTLAGCQGYRHHRAGDEAAAGGDMRGAVFHYERAAAHKPSLRTDPEFKRKLNIASARVAYDDAVRMRARGEFEKAIEQLRLAMEKDPAFDKPGRLLPEVLKQASAWRYEAAVVAADGGDLVLAKRHLTTALEQDPANKQASFAMLSLTPQGLADTTPGLKVFYEGVAHSSERRWLKAEASLVKSVSTNSGLLPARAALHTARQKLAEARQSMKTGGRQIDARLMGPAIEALNKSLEVWPYNDRASAMLKQATKLRAQAEAKLAAASKAGGERRWDDAIALADSGLALDRSHTGLIRLRGTLPGRAAADYTARAKSLRDGNDLAGAKKAYARALGYVRTYRPALSGMADLYADWGSQFEKQGLPGAALLHYSTGRSYASTKALAAGVQRTTKAVRGEFAMGMAVTVQGGRVKGAVDPRTIEGSMMGELTKRRGKGLSVGGANAPYELRLDVTESWISQRMTGSTRRTHPYSTQELRDNPEYDRIARRLSRAQRYYRSYCSDYHRVCGYSHTYHTKQRHGHTPHPRANYYYTRLYNQQCEVDRLRSQLSRTPRQITVTIQRSWPYTVQSYTKTGQVKVRAKLINTATGKPVSTTTQHGTFKASDDLITNANPAIGLLADPLNLPGDDFAAQALSTNLAWRTAPWALKAAVSDRQAQLSAQAQSLRKQGKAAQAIEAEVRSALLLGMVSPTGSSKQLAELAERHAQ